MKLQAVQLIEKSRPIERINYNAVIYEVFLDSVNVKMPPGSRRIKRDVRLSEHIQSKRNLLKRGIPCQVELRQGKPYVIAIFEEGYDTPVAIPFDETDSTTDPTNPITDIEAKPVRVTVTLDCEVKGWKLTWNEITEAENYEIVWTNDPESEQDEADKAGETAETEIEIGFDTEGDPPKTYFSVRAIGAGKKGPFSPWTTDQLLLEDAPGGFSVCPVGAGYRIDVDLEVDTTHLAEGYSHWELEIADDATGLNNRKVQDLVPDDLPLIIQNATEGQWTFDVDTDESWGEFEAADPGEWHADGHTAAGSRILFDGPNTDWGPIAVENQVPGGMLNQSVPQFTITGDEKLTFWIKVIGNEAGPFDVEVRMGTAVWDMSHTNNTTQHANEEPPHVYQTVSVPDDTWTEVTVSAREDVKGKVAGVLLIYAKIQGKDIEYILVDDVVRGTGGVAANTQKWFRIRAATCAGIFGPYTDWQSGSNETAVFVKDNYHGWSSQFDSRYRFQVGEGYIQRSEDTGSAYTDITDTLPAPVDGVLPTEVQYIQVVEDNLVAGTLRIIARWYETETLTWRSRVLETLDYGLTWEWKLSDSEDGIYGSTDPSQWNDYDTTESPHGWRNLFTYEYYTGAYYFIDCAPCASNPGTLLGQWVAGVGFQNVGVLDASCGGLPDGSAYVVSPAFSHVGDEAQIRVTISPGAVGTQWHLYAWNGLVWTTLGSSFGSGTATFNIPTDTQFVSIQHCSPFFQFDGSSIIEIGLKDITYGIGGELWPMWADQNNAGNILAIAGQAGTEMVVRTYDLENDYEILNTYTIGPCSLAEAVNRIYFAAPLFPGESPNLYAYGRFLIGEETDIVQIARLSGIDFVPVIDQNIWEPEDFAGALWYKDAPATLIAIRNAATRLEVVSVTDDVVTYTLDETAAPDTGIKAGLLLLNLTQGLSGLIAEVDTEAETITLEEAPAGWIAGDLLAVCGTGALWTGEATSQAAPPVLEEAIIDIFTVLPGAIDVDSTGLLVIGNEINEESMLLTSLSPYTSTADVSDTYPVAAGVVGINWAGGGCAEVRGITDGASGIPIQDSNGDPAGVVQPSEPGEVLVGTPAVPGQPGPTVPQFRKLKHHELEELGDDDHPQYFNQTRGDARYSQLGHTHTFLSLTDSPNAYTGQGGMAVLVNETEDGLEFGEVATGGGGGASSGFEHQYEGNHSAGASWLSLVSDRYYYKQIVLADACLLTSIGAYLRQNGAEVGGLVVVLHENNSGNPGKLLAYQKGSNSIELSSTGRWVWLPIGVYLPAGTYWIGASCGSDNDSDLQISYDTSGSDLRIDNADYIPDGGTGTNTTHDYSIAASTILETEPVSTNFLGLTDTPNAYTGQAGKVPIVNEAEDGLEFGEMTGGGGGDPLEVTTETIQIRKVLADVLLSSSQNTIDFDDIDQTYDHLEIHLSIRGTRSATEDTIDIAFNGDTTSDNYASTTHYGGSGHANALYAGGRDVGYCPAAASPADNFASQYIFISNYTEAKAKIAMARGMSPDNLASSTSAYDALNTIWYELTDAIEAITLRCQNGDLAVGTRAQLVGIKNMAVVTDVAGSGGGGSGPTGGLYTANYGDSSPYDFGSVPTGEALKEISIRVATSFNGTSPSIKIGTPADDDLFFAATETALDEAGIIFSKKFAVVGPLTLRLTITPDGSSAGQIIIQHSTTGD